MKLKKGIALWNRAKKIIPGGSQLLSKRAEIFLPNQWPAYFAKAKGIEVWDLDGNRYLDTMASVGACILGYADADVDRAVRSAVKKGVLTSLNAPEEVELAELLCRLHPWAGMVRYARSGGEAMAVAVRIARAFSGKDKIAFCGYHGWQDWYLAANIADDKNLDGHLLPGLEPRGVPRGLKGTAIPFNYNNIKELQKIVFQHKDIGAIVMEPIRNHEPENNFLQNVRKIANRSRAVLIVDEITMGWRLRTGGAHLAYGLVPDIAVFAKAMSNGFPMAAIIGKSKVMQAAQTTFISSSYWTERIGPTAALATIKKMMRYNVPRHLQEIGTALIRGLEQAGAKSGLNIHIAGLPPLFCLVFDYGKDSQLIRTLFTQEMLKRGILASSNVDVSYAWKREHVKKYLGAVEEVFHLIKKAVESRQVRGLLKGPIAQAGFKRLV